MKITTDSSNRWTLIVIRISFNFYTARSNFVTDLAYLYFKRATGTFKTEFLQRSIFIICSDLYEVNYNKLHERQQAR